MWPSTRATGPHGMGDRWSNPVARGNFWAFPANCGCSFYFASLCNMQTEKGPKECPHSPARYLFFDWTINAGNLRWYFL